MLEKIGAKQNGNEGDELYRRRYPNKRNAVEQQKHQLANQAENTDPTLGRIAFFDPENRKQLGYTGEGNDRADDAVKRGIHLHFAEKRREKRGSDAQRNKILNGRYGNDATPAHLIGP